MPLARDAVDHEELHRSRGALWHTLAIWHRRL